MADAFDYIKDPNSAAGRAYFEGLSGGKSVSLPTFSTPEEEANYIVQLAGSGAKLSTETLIGLKLALDNLQGQKNQALKDRARDILETGVAGLNGAERDAYQAKSDSIARENGLNWQATANDIASLGELKGARDEANTADKATVAGYGSYLGGVDQANHGVASKYSDQVDYLTNLDASALGGIYKQTGDTNAANAAALSGLKTATGSADVSDQLALKDLAALNAGAQHIDPHTYQDITSAGAAPTLQYQKELARRTEEQDRRNALGAALRDLQARGIRSGGAEIGALMGSEQNTSQARALQDMQALMISGQMTDAVSQFNAAQGETAKKFADELNAQQEKERLARGEGQVKTGLDVTKGIYDRAGAVFTADQGTNQKALENTQGAFNDTTGRTDEAAVRAGKVAQFGKDVNDTGADLAGKLADKTMEATDKGYGRTKDVVGNEETVTGNAVNRFKDTEDTTRQEAQKTFENKGKVQDALGSAESVGINGSPTPVNLDPVIGLNEERRSEDKLDDGVDIFGLRFG